MTEGVRRLRDSGKSEISEISCLHTALSVTARWYVAGMDIENATSDEIEDLLLGCEAVIARERASQMTVLREVDRRQAPTAAGCRSLGEWVAGRLDVSRETARNLVATAHRLEDLPDVLEAVAAGEIGFDRAVAVGRFAGRDDNLDLVGDLAGYDIAGIRQSGGEATPYGPDR